MNGKAKSVANNASTSDRAARSSPYSRSSRRNNVNETAPATPSRIGSLLSNLFSPFRSTSKKANQQARDAEVQQQLQLQSDAEHRMIEVDDVVEFESVLSGDEESEELPQDFALLYSRAPVAPTNGSVGAGPVTAQPSARSFAPVTPAPASSSRSTLYYNDVVDSSRRYAPRRGSMTMDISPPKMANDVLAEFFKERGDTPLTAVEAAGVMQLINQSQSDTIELESLPTAFTPNFRSRAESIQLPSFLRSSTPQNATASTSNTPRSNALSISAESGSNVTPFRRRRPLYVGAGYSTARRRKQNGSPAGSFRSEEDALRSSHSESMLSSRTMDEAMTSTADGKRRRIDDEMDRPSDLAVGNLSRSLSMGASPKSSIFAATSSGIASYSKDQQHPLSSIPLNNLLSQPQVTPVRHSPLWQVSQADIPASSPSPPRQSTSAAIAKATTRPADIMMDIIRQDATSSRPTKVTLAAVANPYESPASRTVRVGAAKFTPAPRSRPSAATPTVPASAASVAKPMSSLALLERTMPAALRKNDTTKRASPAPPLTTLPAPSVVILPRASVTPVPSSYKPASAKPILTRAPVVAAPIPAKKIDVIELSDSDDDEEQDVEDSQPEEEDREGEEEEDEDEEDEEEEDDETVEGEEDDDEDDNVIEDAPVGGIEMEETASSALSGGDDDEEEDEDEDEDEVENEDAEEEEDELLDDDDEEEEEDLPVLTISKHTRLSPFSRPVTPPAVVSPLNPSAQMAASLASSSKPGSSSSALPTTVISFGPTSSKRRSPSPALPAAPISIPTPFSFSASAPAFAPASTPAPAPALAHVISTVGVSASAPKRALVSTEAITIEEAKQRAIDVPLLSLPSWDFSDTLRTIQQDGMQEKTAAEARDANVRGVMKLVLEMAVDELPTFTI